MFNNPGKKIKILATVLFWLEAIAAFITGLALISSIKGYAAIIIFGGIISAWLLSLFVYAFGELVEKIDIIEKQNRNNDDSDAEHQNESARIEKLNKLRNQNLITEEEYKQILHKEKNKNE